jgi:hypothetical protein
LHYAGHRTDKQFLHVAPFRPELEKVLGRVISNWSNSANGRFQYCLASDTIPYHTDYPARSGILFLTPDAPIEAGISFYRSRLTGLRKSISNQQLMNLTFDNGAALDRICWDEVDRIGNIFNRSVLDLALELSMNAAGPSGHSSASAVVATDSDLPRQQVGTQARPGLL